MKIKIYDQIISDIIHDINQGTLKANDKLPTYSELASKYHTSAVTVRKSIAKLINKGYLFSVERVGIFVREREHDLFIATLSPQSIINEEITHTSIEGVHLTLVRDDSGQERKATETAFIGYSDTIPIYYTDLNLFVGGHYNLEHLSDMTEDQLPAALQILDSFDITKKITIILETPKNYIQNKLLIDATTPVVCMTQRYYTLKGNAVGRSVTWIAGENCDLFGKSVINTADI